MISVLFVCLGNICRSPSAEAVFRSRAQAAGLEVFADSAGTAAWHVGKAPDKRAQDAGARRGYALSALRARQVTHRDFECFDFILAMDHENFAALTSQAPEAYAGKVHLFLSFAPELGRQAVPDPYYGDDDGFDEVLDLVEAASDGLIRRLCERQD
ncbi:MAG: phosphotyrosine protein phosphatase [Rhodobiaceae bacterium]|nr:phosphotyrosine protein phosphatase [Rhodobiaceae bacterium]|tara:strand:- start:1218 stop:1685 length:468 start_codon:yes stop_codon:yes gene_type:complete